MPTPPGLTKRKSFRRWLRKMTTPKVVPLLPNGGEGKPQGVFGVPLVISISYARGTIGYQDASQVNYQRAAAIPLVVSKCGSYLKRNGLETEGIFRLSGSTKRVNTLQQVFDSPLDSYGLHHSWKSYNVHDAGSILRRYFLQLPDPVIPVDFYQPFRDVMNDSMYETTDQQINAFQDLICQLPTAHQHLLLYVLDMLRLFATHASTTRMDASNLAAVFTPGLLNHPQHNSPVQYMISQRVIEFLIEYQNLFTMDLLVDQEAKPVEPDEALVSPNIITTPTRLMASPPSSPIPSVPAIPARWATTSSVSPTIDTRSPDTLYSDDMETPTSTILENKSDTWRNSLVWAKQRLDKVLGCIDPLLILWYLILSILLMTTIYEGYLLFGKVALIEPVLFFTGFIGYGLLVILGTDTTITPAVIPLDDNNDDDSSIEKYYIYDNDDDFDKCSMDDDGLSLFDDISVAPEVSEEAVLQDKEVMANWQHLMTRSWRAAPDDVDRPLQPAYPPLGHDTEMDDKASMISMASRFNEVDDDNDYDYDEEEEEAELVSTTDEDLERLWTRYEQFKLNMDN
ncbi:Rho GTPase activation protein [Chlamydoabsidia padenii]|nr:Rho GTPase activation protein [Chlamydoabsidia padenii]